MDRKEYNNRIRKIVKDYISLDRKVKINFTDTMTEQQMRTWNQYRLYVERNMNVVPSSLSENELGNLEKKLKRRM